ncbi:MAG: RNA 2',3'-cyclic phosphodiesterase [Planctomycetaceae bacterium]|nr:RNA 2',3'-cyclic phosphodiesterase [Planctomycetaceae bacterium]
MARIRTFVAIDVSERVRRAAAATISELEPMTESIRWVSASNVHITMKFLGDVEETDIYQVCRLTADAVRDLPAMQVNCRGVGAFPSIDRPRTIWLGVDDPTDQLVQVHQRVEQGLASLGFPREQRRFQPHVTLGRARYGRRDMEELVERLATFEVEAGPVDIDQLVIYASERGANGPNYTVLGRAPLSDG